MALATIPKFDLCPRHTGESVLVRGVGPVGTVATAVGAMETVDKRASMKAVILPAMKAVILP